ncbi:hypothetical protein PsYK624_087610 [Phanerochaete sordida]|uniref:Uncharacterized protein n=1 Tax=Phanerochaete sordida TaxID=48140 RepID=A0A9P3LEJ9_9APHY|nr:hypothetical protein PsYK624_087610 [Phanerochaete sordida]
MPIRWNTVYAELKRGWKLREATKHYVKGLSSGLTGKKFDAAVRKEERLSLSESDWGLIEVLILILEPFTAITLSFSRKGTPTFCIVVLYYKKIETELKNAEIAHKKCNAQLKVGFERAQAKLSKHLEIALTNKYIILGAVLHPAIRVAYFEQDDLWAPEVGVRARNILEDAYVEYAAKIRPTATGSTGKASGTAAVSPATSSTASLFSAALNIRRTATITQQESEVETYLRPDFFPHESEDGVF